MSDSLGGNFIIRYQLFKGFLSGGLCTEGLAYSDGWEGGIPLQEVCLHGVGDCVLRVQAKRAAQHRSGARAACRQEYEPEQSETEQSKIQVR